MKFFKALFLRDISSMRVCSEAVNQSGQDVMGCSAAPFAASTMCFSKNVSKSSSDEFTTSWGFRFWKNSEAFS